MNPIAPVYADYNATSPLRSAAHHAMVAAMDTHGNPSSIHGAGRAARRIIEDARKSILTSAALPDYKLAFTSGATEALSMVLSPCTKTPRGVEPTHLFISASEHVAALDGHDFDDVQHITTLPNGSIDLAQLEQALQALSDDERALVCIQAANNETGVLQPLGDIERLCQSFGAIWICDMVQWAGRMPMGVHRPDGIVLSAHKLGGPAGVGALLYDAQRMQVATPLIKGGGQERGLRGGTENLIGIAGFAAAFEAAQNDLAADRERILAIRDRFENQLRATYSDVSIWGEGADRLVNTSCFSIPGFEAALALMKLDLAGVAVSSGSACSSGKVKSSHVLRAMQVSDDLASCALRISFGFGSTTDDADTVFRAIEKAFPGTRGTAEVTSERGAEKTARNLQELSDPQLVFSRSGSI